MAANLFTWTKARVWKLPGLREEMKAVVEARMKRAAARAAREGGESPKGGGDAE